MNYNDYELRDLTADQQLSMSAAFPVLMRKVYVWMTLALVITGFTSYGVATSPGILQAIYGNQLLFWGMIIAEFALVIGVSAAIHRLSTVFFITAGTFGAMALLGYTTKTDLSSIGKYLIMALIGLIIATVVNLFIQSTGFTLILSYVGVLIFVGLTAYDSQKIKQMLLQAPDAGEGAQKLALLGALTLYLDFINLFIYLLRIFGRRN